MLGLAMRFIRSFKTSGWQRNLKRFRYLKAADYRVQERETFEVTIELPESQPEFLQLCASLGIAVRRIGPEDHVAEPGKTYKPDVWRTLAFPLGRFPQFAQPGDTTIADVPVYVWIRDRYLQIIIAPHTDPTFLDDRDFQRAKTIDDLLAGRTDLRFVAH